MLILAIEDCVDMFPLIERSLVPYEVVQAKTIAEAKLFLQENTPDLILIDMNLPDGDGAEFCAEISENSRYAHIPKIILTAKSETSDKIFGLYSGADDYITKPFERQELKARCDIRLRKKANASVVKSGPFELDLEFQRLKVLSDSGEESTIELTPSEFRVFHLLVSNEGKAFNRNEIVRKIWTQNGTSVEARSVDTHVSHLRKKLGMYSGVIVSVYSKGYSYVKPEKATLAS